MTMEWNQQGLADFYLDPNLNLNHKYLREILQLLD